MSVRSAAVIGAALIFSSACGDSRNTGDAQETSAPALTGSSLAGLAFTSVPVDARYSTSTLSFYDFQRGKIRQILGSESKAAAVFWQNDQLFHFNRSTELRNYKMLDPRLDQTQITGARTTPNAEPGDPMAIHSLGNERVALALTSASKITILTPSTGDEIATIDPLDSGIGFLARYFRPVSFFTLGDQIFVLHYGLNLVTGQYESKPEIFVFSATKLSFEDQIDSTSATLDGISASAQAPTFLAAASGKPLLFGLCPAGLTPSQCTSKVERFDPATLKVSAVPFDFAANPYDLIGRIVDGNGTDTLYAKVKHQTKGTSHVVEINLTTETMTEIHQVQDSYDRGGIFYDSSTGTLFVGDGNDSSGQLSIYTDGELMAEVDLLDVPEAGAAVPKGY